MTSVNFFWKHPIGVFLILVSLGLPLAVSATEDGWQASYWNNADLSGAPQLQQFEQDANHNPALVREWGQASPWPSINEDYFSARFERTLSLQPGRYRFVATADDGVRVWVNGVLIIDEWLEQPASAYTGYADIETASDVPIKIEYYDSQHHARLNVSWTRISGSDAILTDELYEPEITHWRGEYFNNRLVAGTPNLVRNDEAIQFNWGHESPALESIYADAFSVRWTRTLNLPAGTYRFTTTTDDGVRVWINNQLRIDQWHTQANATHTTDVNHAGGPLPVKMEYYDDVGLAFAQLDWEQIGAYVPTAPSTNAATRAWRGEYYNNTVLVGTPALVRQDPDINFDWGFESPDETILTRSAFSVRWTGLMELPAGTYKFTTSTDDGVRLWVNNQLIIDKWRNQSERAFSAEITLPAGRFPVKMEYYNAENQAVARLSWERLDGPLPENVLVPTYRPTASGGNAVAPASLTQAVYNASTTFTVQLSTTLTVAPLYVRAEPHMLADKLGRLTQRDNVPVYGRNLYNNWVLVQMADGRFGWISILYAELPYDISDLPDLSVAWQPKPMVDATTTALYVVRDSVLARLYDQPNILAERGVLLPEETPVLALGRDHFGNWIYVRLEDGTEGWVSILYIQADFHIKSLPEMGE